MQDNWDKIYKLLIEADKVTGKGDRSKKPSAAVLKERGEKLFVIARDIKYRLAITSPPINKSIEKEIK